MLGHTLTLICSLVAADGMADLQADIEDHRERLDVRAGPAADARPAEPVNLSGPRIGATYLAGEEAVLLREKLGVRYPVVTQFGWQFEYRFFEQPGGFTGVNELVLLLGGLDQAMLLPSASWLVGVRTAGGAEVGAGPVFALTSMLNAIDEGRFGMGPGRSLAGIGFALAAGVTIRSGNVNFPFNLALVRSDSGIRLTLLTGFNLQASE